MTVKIIVRAVFFLLLTLLFALYIAPANKVVSFVKLPREVKLYNVSGDVWNGRIAAAEINSIRVRNVDWKLNPLTLFFIKGANINIADESLVDATFGIDLLNLSKRTSLSDVKFTSTLEKLYPLFADKLPFPLKMSGVVEGSFSELSVNSRGHLVSAEGKLEGSELLVDHPFEPGTNIAIGDLKVDITGNATSLKLSITQSSAQFEFEGTVLVKNMRDISVDGTLVPKGEMPESIQGLLPMLGKAESDGKIKIHYIDKLE